MLSMKSVPGKVKFNGEKSHFLETDRQSARLRAARTSNLPVLGEESIRVQFNAGRAKVVQQRVIQGA